MNDKFLNLKKCIKLKCQEKYCQIKEKNQKKKIKIQIIKNNKKISRRIFDMWYADGDNILGANEIRKYINEKRSF